MYNLNKKHFSKQKGGRLTQNVFNQTHYKITANIVGTFATSRLVTLSLLVTHLCCEHNVRGFARSKCTVNR